MITIKKLLKTIMFSVFLAGGFFISCKDFMDVHKEFVEGGEIIYAPKPDSLVFFAGIDRIMMRCWLRNAINVKTIDVSWNNKLNSKSIPVTPSRGLDSIDVFLDNMGDNSYVFNVQTTDKFGNKSLEVIGFGVSYGDIFLNSVNNVNRDVSNVAFTGNVATVTWTVAPSVLAWTEVKYLTALSDDSITVKVMPDEATTPFPDAKQAPSFFKYRSVFLPESNAVDAVFGDWRQWSFPRTSLWLAGNGTPADWNSSRQIEMPFDENNPWVYTCETNLDSNGGEIKILTNRGDYNGNTFRPLVANGSILDTKMQVYPGGTDLKWKVVSGQDGRYKITVDVNKMEIYFIKL